MSTQDSTANSTSGLSQTADQNASFQQVMSLVSTIEIPEHLILTGKLNFIPWKNRITYIAGLIDPKLAEFLLNANSTIPSTARLQGIIEILMQRSISKEISKEFTTTNKYGKDLFQAIVQTYGEMEVRDKVAYIGSLQDKLFNGAIKESERFTVHDELFDFLEGHSEGEKRALSNFLWLYYTLSSFADKYLDNPLLAKLDVPTMKAYLKYQDSLYPKTITAFTVDKDQRQEADDKDQREEADGSDPIFRVQCLNCFGLGHNSSDCPSPERDGMIPQLETRLNGFKTRRKAFQRVKFNYQRANQNESSESKFVTSNDNQWNENTTK